LPGDNDVHRIRRYLVYMLHLWQVGTDEELTWRASLESPRTGERRGFASLEALFAFLQEQTRCDVSVERLTTTNVNGGKT